MSYWVLLVGKEFIRLEELSSTGIDNEYYPSRPVFNTVD